jgi:large subunit ribosomal protein L21
VFKKKRRKAYQKKQGHRQYYTLLRIDAIPSSAAGEEKGAASAPAPEQVAEA